MVNSRDDGPVGIGPTLDGGDVDGGETPGRAYSSVQCLALLSCCFLFLTYSVAIDGTVGGMVNGTSETPGVIADVDGMAYQADPLTIGHREEVSVRKQARDGRASLTGIRVCKQGREGQYNFKY